VAPGVRVRCTPTLDDQHWKSLYQAVITQLVGGRSAKAYDWMLGKTQFNLRCLALSTWSSR